MTKASATAIIARQQEEEQYLLNLKKVYKGNKNKMMMQYVEARLITTRKMITAARKHIKEGQKEEML